MNLHGEWKEGMLRAWMAPFQADCRRQLALECEAETEPAAWAGMGMATYSSGPMPLETMMQRRDFGDTDLGFVHKSGSAPLPACSGYCASGDLPCEHPAICYGHGPMADHARAEMSAAFDDSQAGSLADQMAAASRAETWARIVAGAILAGLAVLAWWVA